MTKRLIVVLAMVVGFFVALPTEPAAAALPHCGGAYTFANPSRQVVGPVNIPSVRLNSLDGGGIQCVMNMDQTPIGFGVAVLQSTLRNCYGQSLTVDGNFGPATRTALRNAQRIHRIPDDGQYGPQTRDALLWWTTRWTGGNGCYRFRA